MRREICHWCKGIRKFIAQKNAANIARWTSHTWWWGATRLSLNRDTGHGFYTMNKARAVVSYRIVVRGSPVDIWVESAQLLFIGGRFNFFLMQVIAESRSTQATVEAASDIIEAWLMKNSEKPWSIILGREVRNNTHLYYEELKRAVMNFCARYQNQEFQRMKCTTNNLGMILSKKRCRILVGLDVTKTPLMTIWWI